ncbi:tail fiber domain-containing protein [Emticicia agri]|uniref:Peptidase S74 domain-containing protein n=1 Tax=Emticicia agri TaxID=2492393 RepID=A0A4V1ZCU1_9BACT|nr:tail fiber domain-containing protein [Emticicia agri]RYU93840.1 hypothetical protein EWM59_20180 [Emticicia agri]
MKTVLIFLSIMLMLSFGAMAQSITLEPGNPADPDKGSIVYDKNTNQLKYWNGTNWIPVTNAAAGGGWAANGTAIHNANTGNVGIGTTTPVAPLHVREGKTVLFGADTSGFGTKFIWYPQKAALRAGTVSNPGVAWNLDKVGQNSMALGFNTLASGIVAVAIGNTTEASGNYSLALGTQTEAKGAYSTALGIKTKATGAYSTALGAETSATATFSTAMGYNTIASGNYSTALGYYTHTNSAYATVIGYNNADATDALFMVGDGFTVNSGHNALTVLKNGNVGIGGLNSPDAPLHVGQGLNGKINLQSNKYFNHSTDSEIHNLGNGNYDVSILANHNIVTKGSFVSSQSVTSSDVRIKNIVGVSDAAKDLALLLQLKITDYRYKDEVGMGNQLFKKVIAQEVEAVYPEAVKQITSIIPDIYSLAEKTAYDATQKRLTVVLAKDYQLKAGDKIKVIHPVHGEVTTIIESVKDKSFTLNNWLYESEKLFVYGREVKDFRTVDYEALSMLGISAIQQLAKEVEELKKQNKVLKTDLTARLEAVERRLMK